ncbi:MAG: hypothetical protein U0103_26040 [Candidatus Obscuribacterales bacterium]|nr:MAG: hypothetical protein EKK48_16100 [Candidatus Melainabacteria bacterium]
MNAKDTTKNNQRAMANAALSLTLVLGMFAANMPAAGAQGMGPDQESLLPPEVVPLDPQVATKMTQSQAATRAMGDSIDTQSAPGLVSNGGSNNVPAGLPLSTGQSAQDFRQAAFNSLMGQPVTPAAPPVNPNLQMMQAQMGQAPGMTQPLSGQTGQSAWVTPGLTPSGMSGQSTGGTQSQTLSGGVKNPEIGRPSKLAKLSHGVGLATMLGSGVLVGAAMSRNPAAMYSTGLFGLGMANYALRNGLSRF